MGKTISEKILSRAADRDSRAGDIVEAAVDRAMSHDNAAMVAKIFGTMGYDRVWDKGKIVIPIDHRAPANLIEVAEAHRRIRAFVHEQGIEHFYDIKQGICHQILPELGHVIPGRVIVGTDSHTTTHGAFGAFSTGIGASEMAAVWATGSLWMKVPGTMRIVLEGKLPRFVSAKDIILMIIGTLKADGASYQAVEYYGSTVDDLSISGRMTLCNMTMEMDAKAGIVPPDDTTRSFLTGRIREKEKGWDPVYADEDASYTSTLHFDVSGLSPQVACPHTVDNVKNIEDLEEVTIDQAVIGSCTNGRLEDLEVAASILRSEKVHDKVRLLIVPASREVYLDAVEQGIISDLVRAEAVVLNPGCGPCLGSHQGIIARGETVISTTNRNFKGRMGHRDSRIYLASPETVAASALTGVISDPRTVA